MFPVAILAGGLATRLRPLTEKIPKALLEIAGRPFIEHQLLQLKRMGVQRVVLCLGYLGEQVQTLVADGARYGLSVQYSLDGPVLLGTGGALRQALPQLGEHFFVLYGDSYLPCSFAQVQAAYHASHAPALMTVLRNANQWDKSNVLFSEGRLVEYNKHAPRSEMAHIDYGLGVLSAKVLRDYPSHTAFDLAQAYQDLSMRGLLAGFEVQQRFYEIGSLQGIAETEDYLVHQTEDSPHELRQTTPSGSS